VFTVLAGNATAVSFLLSSGTFPSVGEYSVSVFLDPAQIHPLADSRSSLSVTLSVSVAAAVPGGDYSYISETKVCGWTDENMRCA
jgi:hypothetical protein